MVRMEALGTRDESTGPRRGLRWLARFAGYIAVVVVVTAALSLGRRATGIDPQGILGQRLHAVQWMIILWVISMAAPHPRSAPPVPRSWGRRALWSALVAIVIAVISHRGAFGF